MKLDAIVSGQSLASLAKSYAKAQPSRRKRLYPVLNQAHARLRGLRSGAVAMLGRATPERRAALLDALAVITADIRLIDSALNMH